MTCNVTEPGSQLIDETAVLLDQRFGVRQERDERTRVDCVVIKDDHF